LLLLPIFIKFQPKSNQAKPSLGATDHAVATIPAVSAVAAALLVLVDVGVVAAVLAVALQLKLGS